MSGVDTDASETASPTPPEPSDKSTEVQREIAQTADARREATILGLSLPKFAEILIVTVAIPLLAILTYKVIALETTVNNARLPELSGNVQIVNDRVSRIYDAFPELRVRIAEELLDKRVRVLVLTEQPKGLNPWRVVVIDAENDRRFTYTVPRSKANEEELRIKVVGLANEIDSGALSLRQWQLYAEEAHQPIQIHPRLQKDLSFGITTASSAQRVDELAATFSRILGTPPSSAETKIIGGSMQSFSSEVAKNPAKFGLGQG